jgi:hypothetical protein
VRCLRAGRLGLLGGVAGAGALLGLVDAPVDLVVVPGEPRPRLLTGPVQALVDLVVVLVQQVLGLVNETHGPTMDGGARPRSAGGT